MKILAILILAFSLMSCNRKTFYLNNVRHAAELTIPSDLDTLVIVNRHKIAKGGGKQVLSVLEGVLSGEPILGDKYGANASVENMKRLIQQSDRLTLATANILRFEKNELDGDTPIKGDIVDSICATYNADGVIALEMFDSDQFYANSSKSAKSFWRLYYAEKKEISDEYMVYTRGYSSYQYYSIVPQEYRAIENAGAYGAQLYYNRIVPFFVRETRYYYSKGASEFKMAKRSVNVNDWEQAIFFWQSFLENSNKLKVNGNAAYNLALAFEVKEDFENAINWIDQSIKYGNKRAIEYRAQLKFRQGEQDLIKEQLKRE